MELVKAVVHREPVRLVAADRSSPAVADPEGVADIDPADPEEAAGIGLAVLEEDTVAEMDPSSKAGLVVDPVEDTTVAG